VRGTHTLSSEEGWSGEYTERMRAKEGHSHAINGGGRAKSRYRHGKKVIPDGEIMTRNERGKRHSRTIDGRERSELGQRKKKAREEHSHTIDSEHKAKDRF
jgi:hypothetical protein